VKIGNFQMENQGANLIEIAEGALGKLPNKPMEILMTYKIFSPLKQGPFVKFCLKRRKDEEHRRQLRKPRKFGLVGRGKHELGMDLKISSL
jgi:hypothetical protein